MRHESRAAAVLALSWAMLSPAQAAQCVTPDNQGRLSVNPSPLAECSGYVLLDAAEFAEVPTLTTLFAVPAQEDMQQAFGVGFGLPMICYLVSWAYGSVIRFATKN